MCSKMPKIVSVDHQLVQETKFDAQDTKYPYAGATFALNCVTQHPKNALEYKPHKWNATILDPGSLSQECGPPIYVDPEETTYVGGPLHGS